MSMDDNRLEALADMTQGVDAENPTHEQRQQAADTQQRTASMEDGARDWGVMMFSIGGLLCMAAPELKPVYSEDRCLAWGQHMQQVAEKHGWNSPTNSPELGLLAATIGFAVPTFFVMRQKLAEAKTAKESVLGGLVFWWKNRKNKTPKPPKDGEPAKAADGSHE
jgi:hypothetical protein